jgi:hypothetical protein
LALSPETFDVTGTGLVPLAIDCEAVVLPYADVAPHWKYTVAAEPLGVTDPFNAALLEVMLLAAVVVTVESGVLVVNVISLPLVVPMLLDATTR